MSHTFHGPHKSLTVKTRRARRRRVITRAEYRALVDLLGIVDATYAMRARNLRVAS